MQKLNLGQNSLVILILIKNLNLNYLEIFPIFCEISKICECIDLKGEILIKSKNKICDVSNKILFNNLKIEENKNLNDNKYLIKYNIKALPKLDDHFYEYFNFIPCSRIFFDVKSIDGNNINPVIYKQKSNLNENNYFTI